MTHLDFSSVRKAPELIGKQAYFDAGERNANIIIGTIIFRIPYFLLKISYMYKRIIFMLYSQMNVINSFLSYFNICVFET